MDPREGVGGRNGLNWVCTLGRRRSSGLRCSLAAEIAAPSPPCRQHPHLHLRPPSFPEPDPCPSLESASFEVLSHCRAEATLGQDQKGEAPFPFMHSVQRLPLPRLHTPRLLAAGHCSAQVLLIFRLLGDPPHCPLGPVSPAPSSPPLWTDSLSLLFSVIFQEANFSEPLTPSFSLCPGQFCLFHVMCGFAASVLLRATQR